jgi:hypothetical protein
MAYSSFYSWIDEKKREKRNPLSHAHFGHFLTILDSLCLMIERTIKEFEQWWEAKITRN